MSYEALSERQRIENPCKSKIEMKIKIRKRIKSKSKIKSRMAS
jgi:hypothetical protein